MTAKQSQNQFLSFMSHVCLYAYGLLTLFLALILFALSPFFKKLSKQKIDSRFGAQKILNLYDPKSEYVFAFCSSAGEFEQGYALHQMFKDENMKVIYFIQSISGIEYIKAKKYNIEYFLAPLDLPWLWSRLFSQFKPNFSFTVRHEFWPSFQFYSRNKSVNVLINCSKPASSIGSFQKLFYQLFDHIFFVDPILAEQAKELQLRPMIHYAPDTKHDRVTQIHKNIHQLHHHKTIQKIISSKSTEHTYMVVGSAWPDDLKLIANQLERKTFDWLRIILCPHDIGDSNIAKLNEIAHQQNLNTKVLRDINEWDKQTCDSQIIIVQQMGVLFELYQIANLCYVGGSASAKIHNVLEAAVFNTPLCIGPCFHSSHEAVDLVESGQIQVLNSEIESKKFLENFGEKKIPPPEISKKIGGVELIGRSLFSHNT